jgi:hypothetical protein
MIGMSADETRAKNPNPLRLSRVIMLIAAFVAALWGTNLSNI